MSDTTHTLHTTHHNLIPSDRVEGTTVYGRDGQKLGIIERLMLKKSTGNVAYAVIRHSGFLFSNTHHYPVLWGALKFNVQDCVYEADLTLAEMEAGLSEMAGDAFDWGNRAPPTRHRSIGACRRKTMRRCRRIVPVMHDYFTPSNSTSKISVAFGGMTPPAPRSP